MLYRAAADAVLILHLAFVVFIVVGGWPARSRPRLRVAHLTAAVYGVVIQVAGFTCPLTPLEKSLRRAAGEAGYDGGFVEHYVVGVLYPGGLDAVVRTVLIAGLVIATAFAYWPVVVRRALTVN